MNILYDLPRHTIPTMVVSAGLSYLAAVLYRGNPQSMALVGAVAALVHSCTTVILARLGLHPCSPDIQKLPLPYELTACLHTLFSVVLTDQILKLVGGPRFDFTKTALLMVGMTLITLRQQNDSLFKNVMFIPLV